MPIQAMEHDFFSTEFDKENELFSELKNMLSPQDFVFSSELASNEPILNVDPNDNDGKALKPLAPAKKKKSFKKKFRLSDKKIKKPIKEKIPNGFSTSPENKNKIVCENCNAQIVKNPNVIKQHLEKHHYEWYVNAYPLGCTHCNKERYVRDRELTLHLNVIHEVPMGHIIKLKKEKLAIDHSHLKPLTDEEFSALKGAKKTNCPQCNKKHTNSVSFKDHLMLCNIKMYNQLYPFTCNDCQNDYVDEGWIHSHNCDAHFASQDSSKKIKMTKVQLKSGVVRALHTCSNGHEPKVFQSIDDIIMQMSGITLTSINVKKK